MRIAILHEGHRGLWRSAYYLRAVAEAWREGGHDVFVVTPRDAFRPADLAVLHVDRTVVPAAHLALARRYPRVLNGSVRDIGKGRFAGPPAATRDYAGPVIVKTARNYGGRPELDALRRRGRAGRIAAGILGRLPAQLSGVLDPRRYPIYPRAAAAPRWFFHDPRFVVQRFLPERHGDRVALRRWSFLGDHEYHDLTLSTGDVVHGCPLAQRTRLGAVPDELGALRRQLGFDFGKFDYGLVDGRVVLYDVNRTPNGGQLAAGDVDLLGRTLAPGLDAVLRR